MIVDCHTHVGDFRSGGNESLTPITWESLLTRLDDEGIDKAILLPIYASPEAIFPHFIVGDRMSIREQVLDAARYPERIICFGNLDPRWMQSANDDFQVLLDWFQEHGCKGIGEVTANMPFNDQRVINMMRQVGERNWPVVFHGTGMGPGSYGLQDEPGSPYLERLLQAVPGTNLVGHGPGFWADIAANTAPEDKMGYPSGPIAEEGALPKLLRCYPNLYCDISAGSGYNALTRDPEYGVQFLNEFADRVIFGTDDNGEWPDHPLRQLEYLKRLLAERQIPQDVFDKITWRNAMRLLGTYTRLEGHRWGQQWNAQFGGKYEQNTDYPW